MQKYQLLILQIGYLSYKSMPRTRSKYTSNNALVLISSTKQFDKIIATDPVYPHMTILPIGNKLQSNYLCHLYPQTRTVNPIVSPKPLPTLPPNYRRQPFNFTFPKTTLYELTSLDLAFLKQCKCRFGQSDLLDEEILREAIISLECSCKTIGSEGEYQQWLQKINKDKGVFINQQKDKEIQAAIFKYWCYRRRQYKFPVYRMSWRTTENIHILHQIYRSRQTRKLTPLHDKKRIDRFFLEELADQFRAVESICSKISARQELKFSKTQVELREFLSTAKHLVETELLEYFTPFQLFGRRQDRVKTSSAQLLDQDQSTQTLPAEESNIPFDIGSNTINNPDCTLRCETALRCNSVIVRQMNIKLSPFKPISPEENSCKIIPGQTHQKNEFDQTNALSAGNAKKQEIIRVVAFNNPRLCLTEVNSEHNLLKDCKNQFSIEEVFSERRV